MGKDPLAVERAELLKMVDRLEGCFRRLQDVEAGVPDDWLMELDDLRHRIRNARSSAKLTMIWGILQDLLKAAAIELIKRLFDTLSCLFTAVPLRSTINETWGSGTLAAHCRWVEAA
jgi:hypothetical protein